jgi:hypothetical protein
MVLLTVTSERLEEEMMKERLRETELTPGPLEPCTTGGEKLGELLSFDKASVTGGVIGVAGALSGVLSAF